MFHSHTKFHSLDYIQNIMQAKWTSQKHTTWTYFSMAYQNCASAQGSAEWTKRLCKRWEDIYWFRKILKWWGEKGVSNPDISVSQTEILMFMFHGEFCIMKFQTRAGAMMCMNRGIKATGNWRKEEIKRDHTRPNHLLLRKFLIKNFPWSFFCSSSAKKINDSIIVFLKTIPLWIHSERGTNCMQGYNEFV